MVKDKYTYKDCDYYYSIKEVFGVKALQALFVNTKGTKVTYQEIGEGIAKGADLGKEQGCAYAYIIVHNAGTLLSAMEIGKYPFRLFICSGEIKDIETFKAEQEKRGDGFFNLQCKEERDCLEEQVIFYVPLSNIKAFPFYFVEYDGNKKVTKISWDEPQGEYIIDKYITPDRLWD